MRTTRYRITAIGEEESCGPSESFIIRRAMSNLTASARNLPVHAVTECSSFVTGRLVESSRRLPRFSEPTGGISSIVVPSQSSSKWLFLVQSPACLLACLPVRPLARKLLDLFASEIACLPACLCGFRARIGVLETDCNLLNLNEMN